MKKFVFIASHLGAGSDDLIANLNQHSLVEIRNTGITYENKLDLLNAFGKHKTASAEAIYGDQLLFNFNLATEDLFSLCKFIFMIRGAKATLNELVGTYKPETAYRYYCYRLERLYQMARRTNGLLLTFETLSQSTKKIEEFLELKTPLSEINLNNKYSSVVPASLVNKAEERYEYYYYLIKNLSTIQSL